MKSNLAATKCVLACLLSFCDRGNSLLTGDEQSLSLTKRGRVLQQSCNNICRGEWPYGCNPDLTGKVNYMCGSDGGCYYSTTVTEMGPPGYCIFKSTTKPVPTALTIPSAPTPSAPVVKAVDQRAFSKPCENICVGDWSYGCNADLTGKVNFMCGTDRGCYYSTSLGDAGPAGYCVFQGPGVQELIDRPTSSPRVPVFVPSPIQNQESSGANVSERTFSASKCGGAVNTDCESFLWNPTNDRTMPCYGYGGPSDPCAFHNNNDADEGLTKDPSACKGDTFYLWDEPDTQGFSYSWAGTKWIEYVSTFAAEITQMRARGVKFTTPLFTAGDSGVIARNVKEFFTACGSACYDAKSPSYIDVIAVNAFVGPWNRPGADGCRDGATFITNEVKSLTQNLPVYITNWGRLFTSNIQDQVDCMQVIDAFFVTGSPIKRVYWFSATDYGGDTSNHLLTNVLPNGTKLGQVWKKVCDEL